VHINAAGAGFPGKQQNWRLAEEVSIEYAA